MFVAECRHLFVADRLWEPAVAAWKLCHWCLLCGVVLDLTALKEAIRCRYRYDAHKNYYDEGWSDYDREQ